MPIGVHQPASPGVPEAVAKAPRRSNGQEEGTGGPVPQRRPGMATPGNQGEEVEVYDFAKRDLGKAIPEPGIYDLNDHSCGLSVGVDH